MAEAADDMGDRARPTESSGLSDRRLAGLSDRELAELVVSGDRRAHAEADRRFQPLFVLYARRFCARLGHRTNEPRACPGFDGCDAAFSAAYLVIRRRVLGVEADRRRGGIGNSELQRYLDRPQGPDDVAPVDRTFAQHLKHCGMRGWQSDVLRAWNSERDLLNRIRTTARTKSYEEAFPAMAIGSAAFTQLHDVGFELPDDPIAWLEALYVDACQTGTMDPIDVFRTARHIDGSLEHQHLIIEHATTWSDALHEVDELVAALAPEYYAETLGRARSLTRVEVSWDSMVERSSGDVEDPTWQLYDESQAGYEQGWFEDDEEGRWDHE